MSSQLYKNYRILTIELWNFVIGIHSINYSVHGSTKTHLKLYLKNLFKYKRKVLKVIFPYKY